MPTPRNILLSKRRWKQNFYMIPFMWKPKNSQNWTAVINIRSVVAKNKKGGDNQWEGWHKLMLWSDGNLLYSLSYLIIYFKSVLSFYSYKLHHSNINLKKVKRTASSLSEKGITWVRHKGYSISHSECYKEQ